MTTTGNTASQTRPRTFPGTAVTDHMIAGRYVPAGRCEYDGEMFDGFRGNGTVRVITYAEDCDADIHYALHVFDRYTVLRYSAEFTTGTPAALVLAAVREAEAETAAYAGDRDRSR